jgi:hypothetical protein
MVSPSDGSKVSLNGRSCVRVLHRCVYQERLTLNARDSDKRRADISALDYKGVIWVENLPRNPSFRSALHCAEKL